MNGCRLRTRCVGIAQIPWDVVYGMRNRIVHDYFEVDLQIVWQTVQGDLPKLRDRIASALKDAVAKKRTS